MSLDCPTARRVGVVLKILVQGCFAVMVASAEEPGMPPNILFIMADDFGCETLGCYGGTSYHTPHLDQLAENGLRFRHCYSMPVCHPTRVCLLTGKYPFRLGNPRWGSFPKSEEQQTVAHVLRRAGYAT
ncbi:MAG: sulfatase-like hydrolase/transferase, partial [Planctomycetales bacterium]